MTKEQQMWVRKLLQQQHVKPAMKQPSTKTGIATFEAQLRVSSQAMKSDAKNKEVETLKEQAWGRSRENSVVTCHTLGSKCKEPG